VQNLGAGGVAAHRIRTELVAAVIVVVGLVAVVVVVVVVEVLVVLAEVVAAVTAAVAERKEVAAGGAAVWKRVVTGRAIVRNSRTGRGRSSGKYDGQDKSTVVGLGT